MEKPGSSPWDRQAADPIYFQTYQSYKAKKQVADPTSLIVVDEADRLQINSLEPMCSMFDDGYLGVILIGVPGIEKRTARFRSCTRGLVSGHEVAHLICIERRYNRRPP